MTDRLIIARTPYTPRERAWMNSQKHYLENAPPGALFAVGVFREGVGLFPEIGAPTGALVGLCIVGRPMARMLPQDGTVGEVTRMYLLPGLPRGTASAVLRYAGQLAKHRGMHSLIAYHDRTRHSGCIYRKSGFKKDGTNTPSGKGWASRPGRKSATLPDTPKRRWRLLMESVVVEQAAVV